MGPNTKPVVSTFVAERGTGQGDNPNPSLWAAFLDILERCLAFGIQDSYTVTRVDWEWGHHTSIGDYVC